MKLTFALLLLSIFAAAAAAQEAVTFEYTYDYDGGEKTLRIYQFWEKAGVTYEQMKTADFRFMQLQSSGDFVAVKAQLRAKVCEKYYCAVPAAAIPEDRTYILTVDACGQRFWGTLKLKPSASITVAKDSEKRKGEILIRSNTPIDLREGAPAISVTQSRLVIDGSEFVAKPEAIAPSGRTPAATVIFPENRNSPNETEVRLKLAKRIEDGTSRSFEAVATTTDKFGAKELKASGTIDIAGDPDPPTAPKTNITIASEAAKGASHNFQLKGTAAFRRPKFATLFGRYSFCFQPATEEARRNATASQLAQSDSSSEECHQSAGFLKNLIFGKYKGKTTLKGDKPQNFFAGLNPEIAFDIGSRTNSKSSNSIVIKAPFIYYLNLTDRELIDSDRKVGTEDIALNIYGGWAKTPWHRLADIKFSFGPKFEIFNDRDEDDGTKEKFKWYDLEPKSFIPASLRADFEFHKWLGTIAERRRLIKADFEAAGKDKLYSRTKLPDFGWKLVPFVAFDGGWGFDDTVVRTISGSKQQFTVPQFGIARFQTGAELRLEGLVYRRLVGFTFSPSLYYLAAKEKRAFPDAGIFKVRDFEGFHPYLKASFEFSLDPAKRLYFTSTWENGLTFPGLDFLNKVSTGVTIKY